jgi:hypothetical protein
MVISNRSELYEKALLTIVGRSDKGRDGLDPAAQEALFGHLQKLASMSHQREGERRIFTANAAQKWIGSDGWAGIEKAMRAGRLPIIAAMGRNKEDVDEYRFGHMSYQEYLTGREYYQELTAARFSTSALVKLFGDQPFDAFTDVKQHLVLQLLAGILSPEQRTMCLAVMCGGQVEAPVLMRKPSRKSATSTRCAVVGCLEAHRNADGYCHNHREAAASALGNATVLGGDMLKIEKRLGRAEMEALSPYLRDNTHLRTLVLRGTKLGKDNDGMEVLVQALETNRTVTALDLSNNDLKAEGAKVVAKLLARCVRACWGLFSFSQDTACTNSTLISNIITSAITPTSRQHLWHHTLGYTPLQCLQSSFDNILQRLWQYTPRQHPQHQRQRGRDEPQPGGEWSRR